MSVTWVNGVAAGTVPADDRGLAYGDGVFETVAVLDGVPVWWDAHLARLARGCEALGIDPPGAGLLRREADALLPARGRGVLKLTVTRGSGPRGYAAPADARPTRILSYAAWDGPEAAATQHGATLRWCSLRLARQPRLAGLKHLNRLEQVLARREWSDAGIHEGLLCDTGGAVVGAVAANLFLVRGGRLFTPGLAHCGVAGVARDWVLRRAAVEVRELARDDVQSADELFLTSSLRGILPVARLDGQTWDVGPMTRALQRLLWQAEPALRPDDARA